MTCRGPGDTSWRGVLVRLLVRQPKLRKTGYLEQTALLLRLLVWLASNTSAPRYRFWNAGTAGVHHSAQLCDVSFCVGDVAGAEDDASQNSANMESKKMQSLNQGRQTLKVTQTSYKDCFILNVLNTIALGKTSL